MVRLAVIVAVLGLPCVLLAACNPILHALTGPFDRREPGEIAGDASSDFHDKYTAGRFGQLYDEADAAFKRTVARAEFVATLEGAHRTLGTWLNSGTYDSKTVTTDGVTTATFTCRNNFERGVADEDFRYVVAGRTARLQGYRIYNVQSPHAPQVY